MSPVPNGVPVAARPAVHARLVAMGAARAATAAVRAAAGRPSSHRAHWPWRSPRPATRGAEATSGTRAARSGCRFIMGHQERRRWPFLPPLPLQQPSCFRLSQRGISAGSASPALRQSGVLERPPAAPPPGPHAGQPEQRHLQHNSHHNTPHRPRRTQTRTLKPNTHHHAHQTPSEISAELDPQHDAPPPQTTSTVLTGNKYRSHERVRGSTPAASPTAPPALTEAPHRPYSPTRCPPGAQSLTSHTNLVPTSPYPYSKKPSSTSTIRIVSRT